MQIQTLEPILSHHPFFQGLDQKYIELLGGCGSNVIFHTGEFLMKEGELANHFYIVRHGKVSIEIAAPGKGPIPIQTVGEGDVLGWSRLISPYRWQYDGRAIELTRAIALDGKCLRGKCDEDHDLGYEMLIRFSHMMAERLNATRLQLLDMYALES